MPARKLIKDVSDDMDRRRKLYRDREEFTAFFANLAGYTVAKKEPAMHASDGSTIYYEGKLYRWEDDFGQSAQRWDPLADVRHAMPFAMKFHIALVPEKRNATWCASYTNRYKSFVHKNAAFAICAVILRQHGFSLQDIKELEED